MRWRIELACILGGVALVLSCSPAEQPKEEEPAAQTTAAPKAIVPVKTESPAGEYKLDKAHASLLFRVNHLGFSNYTARFTSFHATLNFDPVKPEATHIVATVDPRSLGLDGAPKGFYEELIGAKFLDAAQYPEIKFVSTKVELVGKAAARVTGDLTLHGVTKPLTLDATFNGGYKGHPMEPRARIGFSAKGALMRSEYGIAYGVPAPGTTMGVADKVVFIVEAEFNGPALTETP